MSSYLPCSTTPSSTRTIGSKPTTAAFRAERATPLGRRWALEVCCEISHVASPWAKPGAISHVHISQAGVTHTIELILGLPPMSQASQYAPVPYDLFTDTPDNTPYTMEVPTYDQNATNPPAPSGSASSVHVDTSRIDLAGPVLEAQLWEATRLGTPIPKALAQELLTRGGVSREAIAAWMAGRPCRCDPTHGAPQ